MTDSAKQPQKVKVTGAKVRYKANNTTGLLTDDELANLKTLDLMNTIVILERGVSFEIDRDDSADGIEALPVA